ncbi:hypothetical protein [Pseudomonas phage BL1]|nr:hypothetical protein [Pseudomonas phage BL1]
MEDILSVFIDAVFIWKAGIIVVFRRGSERQVVRLDQRQVGFSFGDEFAAISFGFQACYQLASFCNFFGACAVNDVGSFHRLALQGGVALFVSVKRLCRWSEWK